MSFWFVKPSSFCDFFKKYFSGSLVGTKGWSSISLTPLTSPFTNLKMAYVNINCVFDCYFPGRSMQLELSGGLYIGGAPWALKPATWRYPAVWMGSLRRGFVGCIKDLMLDQRLVHLAEHARHQDSGLAYILFVLCQLSLFV